MSPAIKDPEIRQALYAALREPTRMAGARVVSEMGIWSNTVRVDVAVIGDELIGFEIKSERDTLIRLAGQMDIYNRLFDRMTLVCAAKHLDKASASVPDWWGLTSVDSADGDAALLVVRDADLNPSPDPVRIAGLLWKDEALAALSTITAMKGLRSKKLAHLHALLSETLALDDLRALARRALLARREWLSRRDPLFVGPLAVPYPPTVTMDRP
jgi:hypothetical protein